MTNFLLVQISEGYGDEMVKTVMDSISIMTPVESVAHSHNDISAKNKALIESARQRMLNVNGKVLDAQKENSDAMKILIELSQMDQDFEP